MSKPHTFELKCQVQTPTTLLARVRGADGELATKETFDSLDVHVSAQRLGFVSLVQNVAAETYFYDEPQLDNRWQRTSQLDTGFNFELTVAASNFPQQDFYRVEVALRTAAQGIIGRMTWEGGALSSAF